MQQLTASRAFLMTDELFVGVSNPIELGNLLIEAHKRLRIVDPTFSVGAVITYKIHDGIETRINDGWFGPNDYFQLRLSQLEDCVGLIQSETENIPGYTTIKEPFTVGVSMGTYSPTLCASSLRVSQLQSPHMRTHWFRT